MLGNPLGGDSAPALLLRRPVLMLQQLCRPVVATLERARQRRALLQLSDQMLRDIGLTRRDAQAETGKPFWRP